MKTTPKPTGVAQIPNGKWKATLHALGESAYLGLFDTQEEAIAKREAAIRAVQKVHPDWRPGGVWMRADSKLGYLRSNNKSGYTGVSYNTKDRAWKAEKGRYLGMYRSKEDAIRAVKAEEARLQSLNNN